MARTRWRRRRFGAWPLVLLAACGLVEGARPIETAGAWAPAADHEERQLVAIGEADDPHPSSLATEGAGEVRCDLRCDEGVDESVPLPRQACPSEMAAIDDVCIDRWEAHLVVQGPGGPAIHPHYLRPDEGVLYEARSAPGIFPQGYISQREAQSACEAAGKRLCRLAEWRRGCRGGEGRRFPYGDDHRPEACNHGKPHLFGRLFGKDPRHWRQADFDDPRLGQQAGFLAETGAHEACVSPDGLHDPVGNLHEWVADRVTASFVRGLAEERVHRHKQPWRPGNGVFVGGFYSTRAEHGPGCTFTTVAHRPDYHDYSTGFRCCRDADPTAP